MKPTFGFDTSALVSLGHTDLIELILNNLSATITTTILEELKEISKIKDNDGLTALI